MRIRLWRREPTPEQRQDLEQAAREDDAEDAAAARERLLEQARKNRRDTSW